MATAPAAREETKAPHPDANADRAIRPRRRSLEPEVYFRDASDIVIDRDTIQGRTIIDPITKKPVPDGREYFIARNSRYSVYTMPDNFLVRRDKATKIIRLSLDPGWYRIKIVKSLNNRRDRHYKKAVTVVNWGFDFVAGMSPAVWKRVRMMKPQMVETVMTTDGIRPEHRCAHPNCEEEFAHEAALVIHEYEAHFQKDLSKISLEELDDLSAD